MRAVIQRVTSAQVVVSHQIVGKIDKGLLVFLGVEDSDTQEDINWLVGKIAKLRIFTDDQEQMNLSVLDVKGNVLLVSQFTLFASTKKGNRPSFIRSGKPDFALKTFNEFQRQLSQEMGREVPTGVFGAHMNVQLNNDGPVTIIIDTKNKE